MHFSYDKAIYIFDVNDLNSILGGNQQLSKNDFMALEQGKSIDTPKKHLSGRIQMDFCGNNWLMERMRPGQGVKEGIHLLSNELSGNNFSWNAASVPGDVYTDLFRAGEIDDPFYARNMGRAKWVQDYEWWYNYSFNVPEEMKGKNLTLIFDGVDYSCDVWLNTHYLGRHEGMMSSFQFDVTNFIDWNQPHVPSNLLTVKLDPPPKNQKNIAGKKYNFAGDYLSGLILFGIWQPVKLIATEGVRIENYRVESSLSQNHARVTVDVEITGLLKSKQSQTVQVTLSDGENNYMETKETVIAPGKNTVSIPIEVEHPKLWWTYDLGKPFLYDINIEIRNGSTVADNVTGKVGIREIHMEKNPGFTPEESELPWTFVLNGKKIFLRSACWGGPPSLFYGRNSVKRYRYFLKKAKECNINNLRIFGWHPTETKEFYDLCDELGITVWTNFPFATQVFRDDEPYVNSVLEEVKSIVRNRRNHPCTIMWMGGEEVFFSEAHVKSNNRVLMQKIGTVTKSLTNVPYADASPLSSREAIRMGYKTKESFHANSHYYAAGAIFMEDYYPKLDYCIIPELTAASAPNVESLKKFIPENELWPMGLSWGYHAADIQVLKNLNYEVFGDTCDDSLEHFVKATQIAQGTIFQFALEHFRRMKPHVSGVSLCHFITNWPIIKWDIIDYYGEEKLSYEFVKRSYQPLLPSMQFEKRRWLPGETFHAQLWVVNDYYKEFKDLQLSYEIIYPNGQTTKSAENTITVEENSSKKYQEIQFVVEGEKGSSFGVKLILKQNGTLLAQNEYRLLIDDQEEAKKKAFELYTYMHEQRRKYGRGYYRYMPELVYDTDFSKSCEDSEPHNMN